MEGSWINSFKYDFVKNFTAKIYHNKTIELCDYLNFFVCYNVTERDENLNVDDNDMKIVRLIIF